MKGRAGFMITAAVVGMAFGPAFPQEKAAPKKGSGASKAKAEPKAKSEPAEGAEEGQKDPSAAQAEPEPQFKSAKGSEAFQKAKELYDLEQYKESKAELNKAKSEAKTPADRGIVERWIKACEGGASLASYRSLSEKGSPRSAFLMAMDLSEKYRNNPIYSRFTAFTDELRPKVALVIEDFDQVSERYSKKFGKEFVGNPAIVFRGANCIQWTSTRGSVSQLQFTTPVPRKWTSEYFSVVFWVKVEGYPVEIKAITRSPGAQAAGSEPPVMELAFTPQPQSGWQRKELELSQFKKHATGSLANVDKFMLQIDSKTEFKIYIDDVLLLRKDPSEMKAGTETDGKDDKDSGKKKTKSNAGKAKQTERKST